MPTPELILRLLNESPQARKLSDAEARAARARAKLEADIDAASEREGLMMLRGPRRIRQHRHG